MTAKNLNKYTEQQLVRLCQKRDKKGQKTLFEVESGIMLTVCKRYIGDSSTAEELMLIGFMKVFEKIDQFKSSGSLQGWMRRVMVTTCLEWIRKNKVLYKEVDIDDTVDFGAVSESASDSLETEDLMNMILGLPQGYRTIFNMYAIEGYSHQEIADHLGISVNTSKSQLSRARKILQAKIIESESLTDLKRKQDGN